MLDVTFQSYTVHFVFLGNPSLLFSHLQSYLRVWYVLMSMEGLFSTLPQKLL